MALYSNVAGTNKLLAQTANEMNSAGGGSYTFKWNS